MKKIVSNFIHFLLLAEFLLSTITMRGMEQKQKLAKDIDYYNQLLNHLRSKNCWKYDTFVNNCGHSIKIKFLRPRPGFEGSCFIKQQTIILENGKTASNIMIHKRSAIAISKMKGYTSLTLKPCKYDKKYQIALSDSNKICALEIEKS